MFFRALSLSPALILSALVSTVVFSDETLQVQAVGSDAIASAENVGTQPDAKPESVLDARQEPSTTAALQKKNKLGLSPEVAAADKVRKAKMTPEEMAWELVLEESLGPFYLPRYKQAKTKGKVTAWDYVQDSPHLPRVLLIGDSISRGYTVATRRKLRGKVNLHRAPANCGSTSVGLKNLDLWLGDGDWDLILFNFGIHDRRSTSEDYAKGLERVIERLQETGAQLVFATSTPIPKDAELYEYGSSQRLNKAAVVVMERHHIPVSDLYGAIFPRLKEYQHPGDCHFRGEGYELLADIVAESILGKLKVE